MRLDPLTQAVDDLLRRARAAAGLSARCAPSRARRVRLPPAARNSRPTRCTRAGAPWQVRVVPNRAPAVRVEGDAQPRSDGFYDRMDGVGAHEVIIEDPRRRGARRAGTGRTGEGHRRVEDAHARPDARPAAAQLHDRQERRRRGGRARRAQRQPARGAGDRAAGAAPQARDGARFLRAQAPLDFRGHSRPRNSAPARGSCTKTTASPSSARTRRARPSNWRSIPSASARISTGHRPGDRAVRRRAPLRAAPAQRRARSSAIQSDALHRADAHRAPRPVDHHRAGLPLARGNPAAPASSRRRRARHRRWINSVWPETAAAHLRSLEVHR